MSDLFTQAVLLAGAQPPPVHLSDEQATDSVPYLTTDDEDSEDGQDAADRDIEAALMADASVRGQPDQELSPGSDPRPDAALARGLPMAPAPLGRVAPVVSMTTVA